MREVVIETIASRSLFMNVDTLVSTDTFYRHHDRHSIDTDERKTYILETLVRKISNLLEMLVSISSILLVTLVYSLIFY